MKAKGKSDWRLDLKRPLPLGDYLLYVRVTTTDGQVNPLNTDADAYRAFNVKRLTTRR
jgi:hypothetical protein